MNTIWTKEKCMLSANKYQKRLDWHTHEQSAYQAARKNGWLDECCKHMQVLIINWTKEKCVENAGKYKTVSEWIKSEKLAYGAAIRYGWLNECRAHMPNNKVINKNLCLKIAKKHSTINDWINDSRKTYHMAWKYNWLDECTAHMIKKNWKEKGYWTEERCISEASNFNRITDWVNSDNGKSYKAAQRIRCIKKCTAHMFKRIDSKTIKKINSYTKVMCLESSKKHSRINNWIKADRIAFNAAKHYGWLNECTAHMKKVTHWNQEKCIRTARQFDKISDWQKEYGSAYTIARMNGWLDECTAHMKKHN